MLVDAGSEPDALAPLNFKDSSKQLSVCVAGQGIFGYIRAATGSKELVVCSP